MIYALTEDGIIHKVTNKKTFFEHNPTAENITRLKHVYNLFEQQRRDRR